MNPIVNGDKYNRVREELFALVARAITDGDGDIGKACDIVGNELDGFLDSILTQRTINGKSFSQVQEELQDVFDKVITDENGNLALSGDMVDSRLEEVLGLNYSFIPKSHQLVELLGTWSVVGDGEIIIYDDFGKEVCRRGQSGGANVIIPKDSERPKDLPSDYKRAFTDIKKKCGKELGIGTFLEKDKLAHQEAEGKVVAYTPGLKGPVGNKSNKGSCGNKVTFPIQSFKILSMSSVQTTSIRYTAEDADGTKGTLIIWNNVRDTLDDEVKSAIVSLKPGTSVVASAETKPYQGKTQFILKSVESIS